jgi:EpsI family protein
MKTSLARFMAVIVMMTLTLAATSLLQRRTPDRLAVPLETLPRNLEGWEASRDDRTVEDDTLRVLGATSYLDRVYQKDASALQVFIAYYDQQRAGESMHSPKNCLPGTGWEIWKYDTVRIPVGDRRIEVNRDSIEHEGSRFLMLYWYQSKRQIIASEYLGKLQLIRDALVDGHTSGSIVRILIPDRPQAEAEATKFASAIIPGMQRCLGQTR